MKTQRLHWISEAEVILQWSILPSLVALCGIAYITKCRSDTWIVSNGGEVQCKGPSCLPHLKGSVQKGPASRKEQKGSCGVLLPVSTCRPNGILAGTPAVLVFCFGFQNASWTMAACSVALAFPKLPAPETSSLKVSWVGGRRYSAASSTQF